MRVAVVVVVRSRGVALAQVSASLVGLTCLLGDVQRCGSPTRQTQMRIRRAAIALPKAMAALSNRTTRAKEAIHSLTAAGKTIQHLTLSITSSSTTKRRLLFLSEVSRSSRIDL